MTRISILMSYPGFGGAEKNAILMANELSRKGVDVEFVIVGDIGDIRHRLAPDVTIHELGVKRFKNALKPRCLYSGKNLSDSTNAEYVLSYGFRTTANLK